MGGLVLGNPAGAWALLGLPLVLAIHLLQRRRRRVVVTTLFLVEPLAVEGLRGRRIERLHRSTSLWLQLAAVLVLSAVLAQPRVADEASRVRCVVVLDASASMSAFRDRALGAAEARMKTVDAARVDWVVTESSLRRPALYTGPERSRAVGALRAWHPRLASHDLAPAMALARGLAGEGGRVILVTDRAVEPVPGVERLAVGAPTANVGFVGADVQVRAGRALYTALVRNHGSGPARRTVSVEGSGAAVATLDLKAGEVASVSGPFAEGTDALALRLDADAFALDDRLPLVRPRAKRLRVAVEPGARKLPLVERFLASADGVILMEAPATGPFPAADLAVTRDPARARGAALVFLPAPEARTPPRAVAAAPHALTEDLSWAALLVGPASPRAPAPGDVALLASEGRPVAWLHAAEGGPQLHVAFALERSNAARLPAFVILLHRFLQQVRAEVPGAEARNVETDEEIAVAVRKDAGEVTLTPAGGGAPAAVDPWRLRVPADPGFFEVREGREVRLSGAAHFADAAEADLTRAASLEDPVPTPAPRRDRETNDAPWTPVLVLALGALIAADGVVREQGA